MQSLITLRVKKRLRVLWDVTGYEVAKASWSEPKTKEEYFKTLAVFWSMEAPTVLPSLPGIGCDPGMNWLHHFSLTRCGKRTIG